MGPKLQTVTPTNLDQFLVENPCFIWKPAVVALALTAIRQLAPVAGYLSSGSFEPFGFQRALNYTLFALGTSYAVHGWYCVHITQQEQIQPLGTKADSTPMQYIDRQGTLHTALRSCAALCTSWVLAFVPFAPSTTSPLVFIGWMLLFYWYWDLHFYTLHRAAHSHPAIYKSVHKIHHTKTAPDCFSAYFVSYNSNFLLEQLVYILAGFAGMPLNAFEWVLWLGTIDTFIKHSGHDLSEVKLPVFPIKWKHVSVALNPLVLVLGSCGTIEHDLHHEKFTPNYSLIFSYLDKLFGTYEVGRTPGKVK